MDEISLCAIASLCHAFGKPQARGGSLGRKFLEPRVFFAAMTAIRPALPFPRRGSSAQLFTVGLISRLFLRYANDLHVEGLDRFLPILDKRRNGTDRRGLITGKLRV
jgi:hypothetical protein